MKIKRIYDPAIQNQASMIPLFDVSNPDVAREQLNAFYQHLAAIGVKRPEDDRVEEISQSVSRQDGSNIPIRIYMPKDRRDAGPCFINFHMGGFILGDLEMEHVRALNMAARGGAVAIGVDYRLAPEHPFPAGVEDCYDVLNWVWKNAKELKVDASRIAVGGGSAGGNLTAAVALMARDNNGPKIAYQMLFYPVLDDTCSTWSMKNGGEAYIWNTQNTSDMWKHYLGADRANISPYAAPIRAEDMSHLPPAYIMTCEHDVFRDEGILYATKLLTAGVPVELHNYPGTVHGFDLLIDSEISRRAMDDGIEAFKKAMI
ncbi:MAG: alpha/beta hydrolase [Deltaproteobacteria bacterium]|nr:alpha/beta hydrolase [Deltaproteobacteria bacterium]